MSWTGRSIVRMRKKCRNTGNLPGPCSRTACTLMPLGVLAGALVRRPGATGLEAEVSAARFTHRPTEPMLLFLVKAFSLVIWNWTGVGFAGGRTRQGWAAPAGGQAPIRSRGQRGKGIRSGRQIG